ncbi:alpha/beta fold hydrolase [Flavobacterium sp. XGLA_31]|uniref:alpha/beta fold hydrolase n=1 Tax=Flavobacterium sp. XGLA_31 TaxID=3447666 RepID=UPI003F33CD5E
MIFSRIEGEGKPLLIIHGFLGMSDNWKSFSSLYAAQGYQVHLLDLRNHGKSFHSEDFNYTVMMQDVLEYCQHYNLKNVSVIGHSMGGKVAMLLATTHPELVEKLVVADIGPKYYAPHHQDILAGLNAVDFSVKPSRSEVEETLYPYIPDFGTRQFLMKNLYWVEPGQLAFRFNLPVFNQKIEGIGEVLPEENHFDKPTLFIRGGNSKYILDADVPAIQKQFPNFTLATIPNVGHWLHAENPKAFFEETIKFLN